LGPCKEIQDGDGETFEGDGETKVESGKGYVTVRSIHDDEKLDTYSEIEGYAYHKMTVSVADELQRNVLSHNHKVICYFDDDGKSCQVKRAMDDRSLGRLR